MTFIHSAGVSHRDIKFDNILYNPTKGKIKIIDFELARMKKYTNTKLEMLTKIGMPIFRAPEMFTSIYDEKVDIWSIGVIAYKLITGKMPF
jgi:serine/threonine protein kinase